MQLLLPAAYTAIALGFRRFVLCSVFAPFKCRSSRFALRSAPALRSSISSEGSLLFVVCPSRISTHSVSKAKRALSIPLSHYLYLSLAVALRSRHAVSFAKWKLKRHYRLGDTRGKQNGDGVDRARGPCIILCNAFAFRHEISFSFSFADPFADAIKGSDDDVQDGLVHIRIQQRNGRKTLTTVQGLSSEYDLKKIVRACKKVSEWVFPLGKDFRQSFLLSSWPPPFPPLLLSLSLSIVVISPSLLSPTIAQSGRTLKIGLMQTTTMIHCEQT